MLSPVIILWEIICYLIKEKRIMYYIGEVLKNDLNRKENPIVELWDDTSYISEIIAKRRLEKINEETNNKYPNLQIINDKKHDVYTTYPWLKD